MMPQDVSNDDLWQALVIWTFCKRAFSWLLGAWAGWFLVFWLMFVQAADVYSTRWVISQGGIESNPFVAPIILSWYLPLVKVFGGFALGAWLRKRPIFGFAVVTCTAIALWNMGVYLCLKLSII